MKITNKLIMGILAVVVGTMFIIMKGEVLSIALTLLGVTAILMGVLDIVCNARSRGIMKLLIGVAIILFGWLFVDITLIVIAVLMILFCGMNLIGSLKTDGYPMNAVQTIRTYAKPVIGLLAGICLLFNRGGTVAGVFTVVGIVFVIEGIMMLIESK